MFTLARGDVPHLLDLARQSVATGQHDRDDVPGTPAGDEQTPEREPAEAQDEQQPVSEQRPVRLTVLGQPAVLVSGTEIATGLRTDSRSLLALLAIYKNGLTLESAADKLWPDAAPGTISRRFHTALNGARAVLRDTTGNAHAQFIRHIVGRYRLNPAWIDCDLWHFETAITTAKTATTDQARITALRQAADAYTGMLLDGCGMEWAEPPRETALAQAATALTQLSELTWASNPDTALACLERALAIDPDNEQLHQRVMTRQAELGRLDAVRRTYQHLERRLAGIDAQPDQATCDLLRQLTG
jgi:DNA-binding SARP family transcriptional activator